MVQRLSKTEVIYPDSDGQPMADNTKQFRWIVTIKEDLDLIYRDDPNVFVAGDLLWYAVEGNNKIRQAPDAMVVFGRPKGDHASYTQWKEDNIAPQVVFEILSPGNRSGEMAKKFSFYEQYGVQEYYVYDPDNIEFIGWTRSGHYLNPIELNPIEQVADWTSPLLNIRFKLDPESLEIYRPDGTLFQTLSESEDKLKESEAKNALLAAKLKELGINPADL